MKTNSPEAQAAVFQSINAKNIEQLRATIVNGADLNFVLDGSTPLIQSIRAGFKDGIELLLENNPQINLQFPDLYDTENYPKIHTAAPDAEIILSIVSCEGLYSSKNLSTLYLDNNALMPCRI